MKENICKGIAILFVSLICFFYFLNIGSYTIDSLAFVFAFFMYVAALFMKEDYTTFSKLGAMRGIGSSNEMSTNASYNMEQIMSDVLEQEKRINNYYAFTFPLSLSLVLIGTMYLGICLVYSFWL